ncbi:MAG: sensor N-terminal transmembrane domain-containing protein [Magnetospirillum sp.]|nr:sensor N-terminal transmembrane domain-containing protein [Magnetospirillum sp.]
MPSEAEHPGGQAPARRRFRRWKPLRSPLTRRILAVNLIAPVILVAGLFYMDRYKQGLIQSELVGLTTQAEMVAGAVGEGAVSEQALGFLELNPELAQQMVRRLAEPAQVRARLFDAVGDLAADSASCSPSRATSRSRNCRRRKAMAGRAP